MISADRVEQRLEGALPRRRAFVVQITAEPAPGGRLGRVEHLASGAAGDFDSWERLRAFIEDTLARAAGNTGPAGGGPDEGGSPP